MRVEARYPREGEMTMCSCWCSATFVEIPVADVGTTTGSCGRVKCHAPGEKPNESKALTGAERTRRYRAKQSYHRDGRAA